MRTLCFEGYYFKRFSRVKEVFNDSIETTFNMQLTRFANHWMEKELELQLGASAYERSGDRPYRNGHYVRQLVTTRGALDLKVPRAEGFKPRFSLFSHYKRRSKEIDELIVESILLGHSTRHARRFFSKMLGQDSVSQQLASNLFAKFDRELEAWRLRPIRNHAMILVLDAVHLKGVIPSLKSAKPVIFAYAVYPDGSEEVLDFLPAHGESIRAYSNLCSRLYERGLTDVRLIVKDDHASIEEAATTFWPKALFQDCIFHLLQNLYKKLQGFPQKHRILRDASWLFEAQSLQEFQRWCAAFQKKYIRLLKHPAFRYFLGKCDGASQFYALDRSFWAAAKTTNRLEALFGELKRRIKSFRRFPNALSCQRWLFALLLKLNKTQNLNALSVSQSQQFI